MPVLRTADRTALHSRGETKPDVSGKRIVTPECANKGVALDGSVAYAFLTQVVAPRLEIPLRKRWSKF